MQTYFVTIRHDGAYVGGFVCPAESPKEAVAKVKYELISTYHRLRAKNEAGTLYDISALNRVKDYLRSFKRPWRVAAKDRRWSGERVIRIIPLLWPLECGYWLSVPGDTTNHIVNLPTPYWELEDNEWKKTDRMP